MSISLSFLPASTPFPSPRPFRAYTGRPGLIPSEDWDVPDWVNSTYADETRQAMADKNIIYGDSLSYRKMCRFNSGCVDAFPIGGK